MVMPDRLLIHPGTTIGCSRLCPGQAMELPSGGSVPAFELQKRPLLWKLEQEGPEGGLLRQHQDPPLGGVYFPAACHSGKIQPASTLLGICAQTGHSCRQAFRGHERPQRGCDTHTLSHHPVSLRACPSDGQLIRGRDLRRAPFREGVLLTLIPTTLRNQAQTTAYG